MASTIIIYEGDGTKTDFTVPFDYLKKSFVVVRLGAGHALTGGDYGDTGSDYYFLDKTTIRLKVAPSSGESLTIRRYTSATERVVTFKDASILKATDLDTSQVQAFHIAEEGRDILEDSLSVNREGNWDAKGKRIVNVGTPEADSDAVTYGVYKTDAKGAYQAKLGAERARDRAVEAEVNSKESEGNAKASEGNASASAELAKQWATKLGATVDEAEYSAKYYANKANEVLTQVATEVVNRVTAEGTKQVGLVSTEGTKQVDLAKAQVTLATQQVTLATTKASEAEDSATNAANSAGTATTQATEASNSAKAAKLSADNAALSKTAADTSEVNAKASEVEAKKQADLAKQYADQAASGQLQADWAQTNSTEKDFIKNKPTLGALASKDSIAYSEITGTPPEQDLSGLATKDELQTGLASKANSSHTHTVSQITDMPKVVLSVNAVTPDDSGNVFIQAGIELVRW